MANCPKCSYTGGEERALFTSTYVFCKYCDGGEERPEVKAYSLSSTTYTLPIGSTITIKNNAHHYFYDGLDAWLPLTSGGAKELQESSAAEESSEE